MSNLTKKEIEEYLCKVYFIDISNPIKASIKRAYLDFCRTLHGLREYEGLGDNAEKVLERQINELFKLEIDSQESYDQWHKSCCDKLIQCFEVYGNFHYGQAQKWINMSLKYIFVFDQIFDQQLTDNIYQYFHIPIDNVVLEGLKGIKRIYSFTFCCPWSRIDSYEKYLKFQAWFRNTFTGIPMDNEFRLWMGKDLLVKDERASIPELRERETAKAAEQLPETSSEHGFSSKVSSSKRSVITNEMVSVAYNIAKKVFEGSLGRTEGQNEITRQSGMSAGSAGDYITNFLAMISGKKYTRLLNEYSTRYYLEHIRDDYGESALQKALVACKQHAEYYVGLGYGRLAYVERIVREYANPPMP